MGLPEPMRCAASFPVVVKTAHLKALRAHVSAVHRKPFDEVFAAHAANGTFLSQVRLVHLPPTATKQHANAPSVSVLPVQRHLRVPVRPAKGQLRLVRPTHPRFR